MLGRTLFHAGFLVIFINQVHVATCLAQPQVCADTSSKPPDIPQGQKLIVDNLEVQGPNPLTFSQWSTAIIQIKNAALENPYDPNDPRTFNELVEPIRDVLQNEGYLSAVVTPDPYLLRSDGDALHYLLRIAINPGRQYRLAEVRFRTEDADDPALVFSEAELRKQLDLKQGDLFDASKIAEALDALKKLYSAKGFIDIIPSPETDVRDTGSRHEDPQIAKNQNPQDDATIDLTFVLHQGKPYLIAKIEILGLPVEAVRQLQLPQMAGDIFLPGPWDNYLASNLNPPGSLNAEKARAQWIRDEGTHALYIRLDYGSCTDPSTLPITYSQTTLPEAPPSPEENSQDPVGGDSNSANTPVAPNLP